MRALAEKGADVFFTYWGDYEESTAPPEDENDPGQALHSEGGLLLLSGTSLLRGLT